MFQSKGSKAKAPNKYILKNMVGERHGRIPNVQDFVQSILSTAVTNLQHSLQTHEENTVSQGGSMQQFTSLPEELNSCFQIPHTHNLSLANNVSVPQPASTIRVSSQNFNPRQNYSFQCEWAKETTKTVCEQK
jgi:hypothetical protein